MLLICFNVRLLKSGPSVNILSCNNFTSSFISDVSIKTDCYGKDRLFVASFAFCVITCEPIMI